MAVKTLKVCDLCGKAKEELKHNVKIDGNELKEVCDNCETKLVAYVSKLKNPPKSRYMQRKDKVAGTTK